MGFAGTENVHTGRSLEVGDTSGRDDQNRWGTGCGTQALDLGIREGPWMGGSSGLTRLGPSARCGGSDLAERLDVTSCG